LTEIKNSVTTIAQNLKDTEGNLKKEFVTNRKESAETATGLRTEIGNQLNKFTQTFLEQLGNRTKSNEDKLESIRKTFMEKLVDFQKSIDSNSKESRTGADTFDQTLNQAFKSKMAKTFSLQLVID